MDLITHQLPSTSAFIKTQICCTICFIFILISSIIVLNLGSSSKSIPFFRFDHFFPRKPIPNHYKQPCDYSYGQWVRVNDKYKVQLYDENCSFLDPGFRCRQNGRKNIDYLKWRWQPHGCYVPRFNATDFLERSRNGRIVFAGDLVGRNQWESLLCMLAQVVSNKSTIFEQNGNPITKHKGFLSIKFHDYNLTIEYYRTPFIAFLARRPITVPTQVKVIVKVDQLHWRSKQWKGANVIVFNTGHWWNKEKIAKMGCYFQEGRTLNMTMDVMEGFKSFLKTLISWITNNIDPQKSHVFFRNHSPVHYVNGTWDGGGVCDAETEPEKEHKKLKPESLNNQYIANITKVMSNGNSKIRLLNISYLTGFRKDGHPSKYREPGTSRLQPLVSARYTRHMEPDSLCSITFNGI
ncbi:protein trichome birefringence-like 8 [Hibiscus syriacus]|uniref:protein trichome birefringence-like 8 n=1 Tax=Hibiscus syriacus TaxID=106335 RepID=UPI00192129F0|nr:protein trichome birefringence-like 8 [Hibiscus syriacus]